jgi:SAM-dependent methyltransferase
MNSTFANRDVLEFYKKLPFNFSSNLSQAANDILSSRLDILKYYVPIAEELFLDDRIRVLELGCGTGWLSILLAHYYGCSVTGVDFNPVAIEQAGKLNEMVHPDKPSNPDFEVADLFLFDAPAFDIVISHGVLHHTDNCMQGIRKACGLTKKQGHIIIGLYNRFGRKPFLDYFRSLKERNSNEEELFKAYRKLDERHGHDTTLARSWFYDQVLHPHETQHTITEVVEVFSECGVKMIATSLDSYAAKPETDMQALLAKERKMYDAGVKAIEEGRYFTGYFVVVGEHTG